MEGQMDTMHGNGDGDSGAGGEHMGGQTDTGMEPWGGGHGGTDGHHAWQREGGSAEGGECMEGQTDMGMESWGWRANGGTDGHHAWGWGQC